MNSSYCLNMSLCNNHENNDTHISFYNILLNACAKGTCIKKKQGGNLNLRNSGPPSEQQMVVYYYRSVWKHIFTEEELGHG